MSASRTRTLFRREARSARRWIAALVTVGLAAVIVIGLVGADRDEPDRARSLASRLRCPVCQGESVADSPSETANEMTKVIREQVGEGRSDAEILAFFRQRYGDWILLDPPRRGRTWLVWVLPPAAFVAGLAIVLLRRRRNAASASPASPAPEPVLQARIEQARVDLQETDAQLVAGEIDATTALRLREIYEADVAAAAAALETPSAPRSRSRRPLVLTGAVVAVCAMVTALVVASIEPRPEGGFVTGGVAAEVATPAGDGRDLADVTNEEMERVIAANPAVVGMRLALVERYLRDGELEKARDHANAALEHDPSPADRERALKYLGWSTAVLGSPTEGAKLLEESLRLDPGDLDALWFLANVRLEGLHDAAGAVELLDRILRSSIPAEQREVVEKKRVEAQGRLAGS
jgi:cytochrome c-type biogenesis protein CcmH/NrfF